MIKKLRTKAMLRPGEAAELLGYSIKRVRRLIEAGELEAIDGRLKSSKRPLYRITRRSVEEFWKKRRK